MLLRARASAKVNLTLEVLGRRTDGFHELDSLVAFAGCAADLLTLAPGENLSLDRVDGPFADAAGAGDDNLVLKAARAAADRIDALRLGAFSLTKRIPVAAGLGGGSADAGAALRLVALANDLAPDDPRLVEAAAATGSDVPVCLASRAARMTGRGEGVDPIAGFTPVAAVLANPMKGLATAAVFSALAEERAASDPSSRQRGGWTGAKAEGRVGFLGEEPSPETHPTRPDFVRPPSPVPGEGSAAALAALLAGRNDLETPALGLLPDIGVGLDALRRVDGCRLARMSGSGATVFGLFDDQRAARRAARRLRQALPGWWVMPTLLR